MESGTRDTVIKIENLHKYYDLEGGRKIHVLKNINLNIYKSDLVIIYGPSGSGKSTLLNHILGLESPSSGSVSLLGKKISQMEKEKRGLIRSRHLGMVYQIWYWVKSLNVIDNVSIPLLLQGYDFKNAREKSYEMLKMIRMDSFANKSPLHLSGGEQQRICLARALVNNPEIIIADEPTGNLDTRSSDEIMQIFNKLNKEQKRTVVIVTHNLSYLSMTNKTIRIKDGEIVDSKESLNEIEKKL